MSGSRSIVAALLPVVLAVAVMPVAPPRAAAGFTEASDPPAAEITHLSPGNAELHRRAADQARLGAALRAAARDGSTGGAYFDEANVAVFLTTGDPATARAKVLRLLPSGAQVRFLHVKHSLEDLEAVQDRINADLRAGLLRERGIVSSAIDTRANAVVLGATITDAELRAAMQRTYGSAVLVVVEAPAQGGDDGECLSRSDCPPAKGGLRIDTSNGKYCTSGFMVRVVGSNSLRILTAGHCLAHTGGTGTSRKWTHNGMGVGWSEFDSYATGADADAGLINPSSYPIAGDRNLLYRSSQTDIVGITSWKPTAEQVQGSVVCRAGAVSGYLCGAVTLTNKTMDVDGTSIDHQWVVNFDACPGDSGAPYLVDDVAWGIHSDSTYGCNPGTNQAWYSPIGWVLDTLAAADHPIELCTDPSCGNGANAWLARGSLQGVTWNPQLVTLDDGRVLKVGGDDGDLEPGASADSPPPDVEIFDPASGTWSAAAAPPWLPDHCAGQFATAMADGTVLVGGGAPMDGAVGDRCGSAAFLFDPSSGPAGAWTSVAPMPASIVAAGAVALDDGRVFVAGGTGDHGTTPLALAYSPTKDRWTTLTPPPTGAFAPLVLRLGDGRVLVAGGYTIDDPALPSYADSTATYLYDPDAGTWSTTTSVGRRGIAGVVLADGRAVVAGGEDLSWNGAQQRTFVTNVRVLNPASGSWTSLAPLRSGRSNIGLVQLPNGQLMAAGGSTTSGGSGGQSTKAADVYDWLTNTWYAAAAMSDARAMGGIAVMDDGMVLVAGGGTASSETYWFGDISPPVGATPVAHLRSASTLNYPSVPATVAWASAHDGGGAGVGTYDIARSTDGGAYVTLATNWTSTSYPTSVSVGHTYTFRVRARDWAGNVGSWQVAATVKPAVTQQTSSSVTYSGTWSTGKTTQYTGDTVKYATTAGASATYSFTGRAIAWVTTKAKRSGSAKVYIDGVLAATLNLYASTYTYRYIAFERTWSTSGAHTIKIVVVGTAGHPRIDIDAFLVLRNP